MESVRMLESNDDLESATDQNSKRSRSIKKWSLAIVILLLIIALTVKMAATVTFIDEKNSCNISNSF
jgi:hypothetical protein